MRAVWITAVGFLVGLGVGRWSPAERRATVEREVARSPVVAPVQPVTGMLRIPDRVGPRPTEAQPSTDGTPDASAGQEPAASPRPRGPRRAMREAQGEGLSERIAWAADAWRMRSEVARGDFLAQTGLDREGTVQFDVLMEAMNERIGHAVAVWVDEVAAAGAVVPEDGARLLHEVTGALVLTYAEMDRTLPAGWREAVGPQFDVVAFVDPSVAMPLADIEAVLESSAGPRW